MNQKEYWETCGKDYAHLWTGGKKSQAAYEAGYRDLILNHMKQDLTGATVIDYGCGGGYLGALLLRDFGIKKYIGIDIAKRSIEHAKENLAKVKSSVQKFELFLSPKNFAMTKADALFSFACIQHMPTQEMLDDFLSMANRSQVSLIGLHFRHGKRSEFVDAYSTNGNVGLCCRTNDTYYIEKLNNFKNFYTGPINKESGAQAVIYKK